ncbi:MAG: YcbK family protein [Deltaproteobacteria bacterium]|nr:YcbK family protein [Deltaproteobacteria bacterium]
MACRIYTASALSLSAPPPTAASVKTDGRLVLYSYLHKEVLEIRYRLSDGTYDSKSLIKIASLMRSPDGAVAPIDPRLIELIDAVQDRFGADTVEIISGYRSPAYNTELKATGHNVARESLHLQGQAADIHLDEATERAIRDFAVGLQRGGVGYYPSLHFVHVDLGPVRQWAEVEGPRKLVGMENNTGPCELITDRNVYFPLLSTPPPSMGGGQGEGEVRITIRGIPTECDPKQFLLEHFRRGEWQSLPEPAELTLLKEPRPCPARANTTGMCVDYTMSLAGRPFGKYRLRLVAKRALPSLSNEFYLKRE